MAGAMARTGRTMAGQTNEDEMRDLGWLPARTRRSIGEAVDAVARALADDFLAAALVGAAASPARADRARGPQVLVIARSLPMSRLAALAERGRATMRAGVRLRALTAEELRQSCDVFALEIAEWRDRHVLLRGDDPFAACVIERADMIRSLEAAARGLVRRLRNRVLADLGTQGKRDDAAQAVGDALERSLVIAHHFLALNGEPPADEVELLRALSAEAGADESAILAAYQEQRRAGRVMKPLDHVAGLLPWLEAVAARVDRAEAG